VAFPDKLLNQGERVVVSTRTHPKALIRPLLVLVLALGVAAFVQRQGDGGAADVMHWGAWLLAGFVILWWAVRPAVAWATTTYTFTNRRFVKRSGLVAKEGRTIPLNRISGVDFEIGVVDRVFGCGTLVVSDASEQGRVELHDIPRVEQVQLQVAEELHRLANPESPRSDHGA
jgi:uncharacterized membrane protein YdbT with pleckstrin-like domain